MGHGKQHRRRGRRRAVHMMPSSIPAMIALWQPVPRVAVAASQSYPNADRRILHGSGTALRRVECTIRSGNRVLRRARGASRYRYAKARRNGSAFNAKVERRNSAITWRKRSAVLFVVSHVASEIMIGNSSSIDLADQSASRLMAPRFNTPVRASRLVCGLFGLSSLRFRLRVMLDHLSANMALFGDERKLVCYLT